MKKFSSSVLLFLTFLPIKSYALEVPKASVFDQHIQKLSYNAANVTEIKAQVGYVTAVNFASDEKPVNIVVGFKNGWQVVSGGSQIFITPVAYHIQSQGNDQLDAIEPNPKDWNTNMIVTTTNRIYSFDLKLSTDQKSAYLISFNYPDEIKKSKQKEVEQKAKQEVATQQKMEEQKINEDLNKLPIPKNWNYAELIRKGSDNISPDFVYDDGTKTYFGFDVNKSIPSVFYYADEKQEMMTNISRKQQGRYTILIALKTSKKFILRSGKQAVGILNNSYGMYIPNNDLTSNKSIKRVVK